jgi:hypothetical protein
MNPHERIRNVGSGPGGWKQSQEQTIKEIEEGSYAYYVTRAGRTVDVIVATSRYGNKYIKTTADGEQPDNLLSLPECL